MASCEVLLHTQFVSAWLPLWGFNLDLGLGPDLHLHWGIKGVGGQVRLLSALSGEIEKEGGKRGGMKGRKEKGRKEGRRGDEARGEEARGEEEREGRKREGRI